jgi:hypothetical protein
MKWLSALFLGLILGIVLPTALDMRTGLWMQSWAGWGTIRPRVDSPGLLLSIPVFLGAALACRMFFTWHRD